ncbi:bifunctional pyridoxamine 5'-phosphate oxidase family protein/GNAT family N-acetyltransferase [Micromonospora sp. C28SCA-DRY-2]|uniref:bifunctional pyridoxamine 5'-phosphate oxidase family protein/GNAT family N-acetyltransferase n=1 Tax=Micromonospora sp. C28SCA-DRY-2 TaxID=3059522 RepID=UPI002675852B|nr:bifunctional pyridoxamine 5'-phosphate oxidase family protein/GNAT family N-acetyltransferase [Micromonospora sp. C28SCA-DRY-2]MDO3700536.1 bifunctional pyridoxamine 5'-phosphate oxidase family protein/GNAT family N-acetyltransferase [Micromonospora sp. C28SCA-DRY-2]
MYPPTPRTTASRSRERMSYDRAAAHAVLDEAYHCALGFAVDGEPRVLPTLHVRLGDTLYLHGSTGSRPLLAARGDGLPVCVAVTLLDGLVYGRSQFHHSANYRSVVAHGTARLVTDEREKADVLAALVEKVGAGRSADSRPPSRRELAETAVLALPLREVSVRARTGGVRDEEADLDLPHWAGVVPLRLTAGVPEPDAGVTAPVPAYLRPGRSPWLEPAVLRGEHVVLEPLDLAHADELHTATADPDVWRHLGTAMPADPAGTAEVVAAALAAHHRGERVPWVQRCAVTGAVVGTTSYYEVDPDRRAVAIGYTFLGRPWWRTGINTEAKLLLLTRAFDELGALRVVWHTDIRNERSQRAIERLGATREGVLRMHRQRADGSWRDTVQYSMTVDEWRGAQVTLRERLRRAAPVA